MFGLTPQLLRRLLLPASYLVFFAGMMISGSVFFRGKPFDVKAAVLSDLESPDDNPHGYEASAAGIALSAILLIPAATLFYLELRKQRRMLALMGAIMFALGLAAAILIGVLAPFTHGYSQLHVQLAYAVFIGICGGIFFHLAAARAAPMIVVFQCVVLLFLIYMYIGPDFLSNRHLLTSLAFWEWILCVDCGLGLWVLARTVESIKKTRAQRID